MSEFGKEFVKDIQHVLNCHGVDNALGMPDWLLAENIGRMLTRLKRQQEHFKAYQASRSDSDPKGSEQPLPSEGGQP